MKFSVIPSDKFKKEAKRLGKKYPSLKGDLEKLGLLLEKEPRSGTALGNDLFKIRLAITSKGKGKSGGGRVITYLVTEDREVYLMTIYDKSEFDSVDDRTLKILVANLNLPR